MASTPPRRCLPGSRTALLLLSSVLLAALPLATFAAELPKDFFSALEYRFIGPVGNRVPAVTGVPGVPGTYFAGAASGGIFKTTDGGAHWKPVFDDTEVSSIGSLAVAPSDPNVVWAGTGETFLRANISIGDGIYKSTDGGETWKNMGLGDSGRIGRVVIHPTNPDIVYAAALGHVYGPQEERGIFRTTDGGETWERVLFVDPATGASDLAMDPANPRVLFAGMWQIHIDTWSRTSGGPGSSLWVSRDGGDTWSRLEGRGLPEPPWGKIGLAMTAADPRRVYALIETSSNPDFAPVEELAGVLWRSDDGGESWTRVSSDLDLIARPLYYTRAVVAPDDRDEIHFPTPTFFTSLDGGLTSFEAPSQPGWDHHDMWIDPRDPERMIVGHDGGVSISINRGRSWLRPQLPIAQMYHAAVDHRVPYFVYGNRQDGPTTRGPSNTLTGEETIPIGEWRSVGGCETGFAVPDPKDPDIVWSGCYDGILDRHDLATGLSRDVSIWPESMESRAASEVRYRFQWTYPIAVSSHDGAVYVGSHVVHRSTDGGHSWQVVSPDLTSDDPELQRRSGGLTLDDASPTLGPSIFALAVSPREPGLIWAGTNDGKVQLTRDGGTSWSDVTARLPDLPPRGTISNIEPSRHTAGVAYLTVDRHQLGDTDPYVFLTRDYGQSWTKISSNLPRTVLGYAHCVAEDPVRPGLLYLGTESGVRVSFDAGGHWSSLQSNLPHAPVHWLVVQDRFDDLVVATYGRGFWILDDVTPLRRLDPAAAPATPRLFPPREAWRFRRREAPMSQPEDPAEGRNPPYGAVLHYFLPADLGAPEGATDEEAPLSLEILDAAGEVVFRFEDLAIGQGLHRVVWDLHYEKTPEVRLRTKPALHPRVEIPDEEGWRPLEDGEQFALLAPPGAYTVRLRVGEEEWTEPLTVRRDPQSPASEEDLRLQMELLFGLRAMLTEAAGTIHELEWTRWQLGNLRTRLAASDREDAGELGAAAEALEGRLAELESRFFDLRLTGAGQDFLRWERRLYAKLAALAGVVAKSDSRPTAAQREVYELLSAELTEVRTRWSELTATDLPAFERRLDENGVPRLLVGVKGE